MTGISATLNIAKQALAVQQAALNVAGQNIANVDNSNYSRQLISLQANQPIQNGGQFYGTGVDVEQVTSACDQILETRLMNEQSSLSAYEQMQQSIDILESVFNEDSDNSLGTMISDFFTSWQDLSNNPSGDTERMTVYEAGVNLSDTFNSVSSYLVDMEADINLEIEAAIDTVNGLTEQIAQINNQIVASEASGTATANDFRDQRNELLSELSELIGIDSFEQSNGSVTITAANGFTLVSGVCSYALSISGTQVTWEGSSGAVSITDSISGGSIGGLLEIRDEIIPTYQENLDALAGEFIRAINLEHSQGMGTEYVSSSVSGTYATDSSGLLSSLPYGDKIDTSKDFRIWIRDTSTAPPSYAEVTVDLSGIDLSSSTLSELADTINTAVANAGGGVTATVESDQLVLSPDSDTYGFAFGDDGGTGFEDSGLAAALGINTFFTGSDAASMGVNDAAASPGYIAAAKIDSQTGEINSGDNSNALSIADVQYASLDIVRWSFEQSAGSISTVSSVSLEEYYQSMISSLGITAQNISGNLEFSETMVNQLQVLRDENSAVSLDEEMINLMKYQAAYSAASKLLSTADEMLEELLSLR